MDNIKALGYSSLTNFDHTSGESPFIILNNMQALILHKELYSLEISQRYWEWGVNEFFILVNLMLPQLWCCWVAERKENSFSFIFLIVSRVSKVHLLNIEKFVKHLSLFLVRLSKINCVRKKEVHRRERVSFLKR